MLAVAFLASCNSTMNCDIKMIFSLKVRKFYVELGKNKFKVMPLLFLAQLGLKIRLPCEYYAGESNAMLRIQCYANFTLVLNFKFLESYDVIGSSLVLPPLLTFKVALLHLPL